ncbi:TRAP transporter small permease subunit [Saccharopolyspora montiporae]|nr:TRAP transporter small permease subunit [Saccharopolyspora sp. HNM0983]
MSRLETLVLRAERVCTAVSGAALVVLAALMTVEVVLRYAVGSPLSWSMSFITEYLLLGMFFLAMSPTWRLGGHVRIDVLYTRMPPRVRRSLDVGGNVLCLLFAALLLYAGLLATHGAWAGGEIPPPGGAELSWPTWISRALLPIGAAVLVLRLISAVFTPTTTAEER